MDSSIRRAVDVVAAVVGLVVFSPLLVGAAFAVRLSGPGPILFRQERIGRGGRSFDIVKFRTMRAGTHDEVMADDVARAAYVANGWKLLPDDPRITRVGRWLRRTSIDELPQLLNVLRGEMSIVGVRPLLRGELGERGEDDRALYASVRPGMTGLWQVEGRSSVDPGDRVELDRRYLTSRTLAGDAVLVLRTPAAVLRVTDTS